MGSEPAAFRGPLRGASLSRFLQKQFQCSPTHSLGSHLRLPEPSFLEPTTEGAIGENPVPITQH
jgi:hypothetical protein